MSNRERERAATSPAGNAASGATPGQPGAGDQALCPRTADEPSLSDVPALERDVLQGQHDLDLDAARVASERAKNAAKYALATAEADWTREQKKYTAAEQEAKLAREAARKAADFKFTTDRRDASRTEGPVPADVSRLLEEQRCKAIYEAEVAYWEAIHKAELDRDKAEAAWRAAQRDQAHAVRLADKKQALEQSKANIKYYEALGKILRKK